MTQLSAHFTAEELNDSATAAAMGDLNTPTLQVIANEARLATLILEPGRALACQAAGVDVPINVHDGYRDSAVNDAVHGAPDSQHCTGEAADVDASPHLTLERLFDVWRRSSLPYDQIILEEIVRQGQTIGCVHISVAPVGATPRRQALVRHGSPGAWTYTELG